MITTNGIPRHALTISAVAKAVSGEDRKGNRASPSSPAPPAMPETRPVSGVSSHCHMYATTATGITQGRKIAPRRNALNRVTRSSSTAMMVPSASCGMTDSTIHRKVILSDRQNGSLASRSP